MNITVEGSGQQQLFVNKRTSVQGDNVDPFASTPTKGFRELRVSRHSNGDGDSDGDDEEPICATQTLSQRPKSLNGSGDNVDVNETLEQQQQQQQFWGELVSLGDTLKNVSLQDESMVLGRLKSCNIHVADAKVSAKHCRLFRNNDSIFIQDLSTNGTYVNGRKLGRGNLEVVKNGDRISLAGVSRDNQLTYVFKDLCVLEKKPVWETLSSKVIFSSYDFIGELGRGSFSVVYLGVNKETGMKVAIKDIDLLKYNSNPRYLLQLNREIEILKATNHPNIIEIFDIFQSDNHIYIVMELATGGELYEKLANDGSLDEYTAKIIFKQLLMAVKYLHDLGIAHRDLKPENILFDNDKENPFKIKITDFGLARVIGDGELAKTLCGTPAYVAPEVIISKSKNSEVVSQINSKGYGFTCDAWSLGAILYVLLSGNPPFFDDTDEDTTSTPTIFEQIVSGGYSFPEHIWADVSFQGRDLVSKLLTVNPTNRITIAQALAHPWITDTQQTNLQQEQLFSQSQSQSILPSQSQSTTCNNIQQHQQQFLHPDKYVNSQQQQNTLKRTEVSESSQDSHTSQEEQLLKKRRTFMEDA